MDSGDLKGSLAPQQSFAAGHGTESRFAGREDDQVHSLKAQEGDLVSGQDAVVFVVTVGSVVGPGQSQTGQHPRMEAADVRK